jgi:hypothetical protein
MWKHPNVALQNVSNAWDEDEMDDRMTRAVMKAVLGKSENHVMIITLARDTSCHP